MVSLSRLGILGHTGSRADHPCCGKMHLIIFFNFMNLFYGANGHSLRSRTTIFNPLQQILSNGLLMRVI